MYQTSWKEKQTLTYLRTKIKPPKFLDHNETLIIQTLGHLTANVATVTGEAFGAPDCIRISYAASELQLREAIKRIKTVLS